METGTQKDPEVGVEEGQEITEFFRERMIFLKRLFVEENTFSYNKPDYNPQYIFIRKKIILRI